MEKFWRSRAHRNTVLADHHGNVIHLANATARCSVVIKVIEERRLGHTRSNADIAIAVSAAARCGISQRAAEFLLRTTSLLHRNEYARAVEHPVTRAGQRIDTSKRSCGLRRESLPDAKRYSIAHASNVHQCEDPKDSSVTRHEAFSRAGARHSRRFALYSGYVVPPVSTPLIGKLITYGEDATRHRTHAQCAVRMVIEG